MLIGTKGVNALVSDAADGTGGGTAATLVYMQVASLQQRFDLYAEISSRGASNLTQIHEIGTLQAIEGHHDFQSQLVVQQGVDDRKLKTHSS